MKKKQRIIGTSQITMLFYGIVIGVLAGFIIVGDFNLPVEYSATSSLLNLLIIICTYYFAVSIHELGHVYSFVKNGVQMRAIFLSAILFIKDDGIWRIKWNPNKLTAIGGIAIPDLPVINDEADFKRMQNVFARAILAGPITSILLWIVLSIIIAPWMVWSENPVVKSILLIFISSLTVISLFLIVTCLLKNETAVGDFPAYKLSKKDSFFVAIQLYQYVLFSSEPERRRNENHYLKEKICDVLAAKLKQQDLHVIILSIIDSFVVEYLAGFSDELPEIITEYMDLLLNNPRLLSRLKNSEPGLLLHFHIIRFLFVNENSRDQAFMIYQELKNDLTRLNSVMKYLVKQMDDLMGVDDYHDFLMDKRNIRISTAHDIWKNFDGYYMDEIKLNEYSAK